MKVKIIEINDFDAQIEFKDVDYSFVNSIRRALISMVPCLAIHQIDFHMGSLGSYIDKDENERDYESISAMFNEIIAHRIGLLPIPTDKETIDAYGETIYEDDSKQPEIMYSLHKQGPCTVHSGDLEPVDGDAFSIIPETKVPLVKLAEGEAILIYAKAKMGTAEKHTKWQSVVAPRFYQAPTVKISEGKKAKKILDLVGKKKFKKKGKHYIIDDPVEAHKASNILESLWNDKDAQDAIQIDTKTNHFIFEFETNGALTSKLALNQALNALNKECHDFISSVNTTT